VKTVGALCQFLDSLFPILLAESWDNTGLLIGDRGQAVHEVMTCLTLTPTTIQEAIDRRVDLVVSHHPLPFRPVSQITNESPIGTSLLRIIQSGIAVYSPHTRFDSAAMGINELLASRLGLQDPIPLVELSRDLQQRQGAGRFGRLTAAISWAEFVQTIKESFGMQALRGVAPVDHQVLQVAVACGSGGSLLPAAIERGCDTIVTGELSFHSCLECESRGLGVVLLGHYPSERFGIEYLALRIQQEFSDLGVWASERESDPIRTF
jgi:dinuclear metal center YbgI/SA1388 family protein